MTVEELTQWADELEDERDALVSELGQLREAARAAIKVLQMEFPGSIKRKAAIAQLEAALNPKVVDGSQTTGKM